jgi:hypothetical protein
MTSPLRGTSAGEGQFLPAPAPVSVPSSEKAAPARASPAAPRFRDALAALGRQVDQGEKLISRALAPGLGQLSASELIALQAGIYRYSEAVDLGAKLVDRAGAAVKTILQGQ